MAKNKQWQGQETAQAQSNPIPDEAITEPLETQQIGETQSLESVTESSQEPVSATPQPPVASPPDIDSLIGTLTADQLARIRLLASQKGLVDGVSSASGQVALDGSLTVDIRIEPEMVEQLRNWQDGTDVSLADTARRYITEALTGYIYGDWNPTPEPAPVVATTK